MNEEEEQKTTTKPEEEKKTEERAVTEAEKRFESGGWLHVFEGTNKARPIALQARAWPLDAKKAKANVTKAMRAQWGEGWHETLLRFGDNDGMSWIVKLDLDPFKEDEWPTRIPAEHQGRGAAAPYWSRPLIGVRKQGVSGSMPVYKGRYSVLYADATRVHFAVEKAGRLDGMWSLQKEETGDWSLRRFSPLMERCFSFETFESVCRDARERGISKFLWPRNPASPRGALRVVEVEDTLARLLNVRIVKREDEQRYTLAVAYPANQIDAHGDFATAQDLEKACWDYNGRVGLMHKDGTTGSGRAVETYIWRGAPQEIGGEAVNPGDWMLGVIWSEKAWAAIKKGELTGYSIQGYAARS